MSFALLCSCACLLARGLGASHPERFAVPLHSILAVTDFSSIGDHALTRAALLCAEHGATLKLIYLAYPGETPPRDASCRLAHHAQQLGQRHGIRVRSANQIAHSIEDVLPEARCADVLVWGTTPASSVRSFFMGQPLEGVLRRCQRPVLVVRRQAKEAYGRLLVAVDFSETSRGLVELGFALNKLADVELFHAISTANEDKLWYAEVSQHAITSYRHECRRFAQGRMFSLTDSYDARRNRALSAIGHGDPAQQTVVQQQHSGAELIVVGKHPASLLTDRVFGSIAKRVLRYARTDVLVVPHDYQTASKASAVTRLNAEPRIVRRLRAGTPLPPGGPNPAAVMGRA